MEVEPRLCQAERCPHDVLIHNSPPGTRLEAQRTTDTRLDDLPQILTVDLSGWPIVRGNFGGEERVHRPADSESSLVASHSRQSLPECLDGQVSKVNGEILHFRVGIDCG
jgi:hypothetical protein